MKTSLVAMRETRIFSICKSNNTDKVTMGTLHGEGAHCVIQDMSRKRTLNEIRPEFTRRGYILLSTEYKNNCSKLMCLCPKRHACSISWNDFSQGRGCIQCACDSRKVGIEKVRKEFNRRGYSLLSTHYINCDVLLRFECPKGHQGAISWSNFRCGHGCAMCTQNQKMTIEKVRCAFENEGYQLESSEYVNAHTKLPYRCPRGHRGKMTWNTFQTGHRCARCQESKGEKKLQKILEELFPQKVQPQDNLGFLGQQAVDFSVRSNNLAFEYDGEQHFQPVRFRGISEERAKRAFRKVKQRDARKEVLCRKHGYRLIRISYAEKITVESLKKKIGDIIE